MQYSIIKDDETPQQKWRRLSKFAAGVRARRIGMKIPTIRTVEGKHVIEKPDTEGYDPHFITGWLAGAVNGQP